MQTGKQRDRGRGKPSSGVKRLIREHNEKEKQMPIREPDLLIILTGGQMAYTRPDGVKIIPLGCLKD